MPVAIDPTVGAIATSRVPSVRTPLGRSLVVSMVLHGSAIAALLLWQVKPAPPRPPVYRVNLVGAPPGPRAIGVVDSRPAPTAPVAQAQAPSGIERPPPPVVAPTRTRPTPPPPARATPTPSRTAQAGQAEAAPSTEATAAPRAGSSSGGRGADVATIRTDGIAFPAPGYLNNIVRQVYVRFSPPSRFANRPLRAEVSFLIARDGSVSEIRVEQTSGEYAFDLEARSAIEAAGTSRSFGPLPQEWTDDVLRVYLTFTPPAGAR
jgi:protein TonB